jgi:2-polyprenyl-3-methyl-5-hydroxy-6-metoxy-1,4-benzoquinol methylase/spore coat polysaccharide biosynthesis predicted glycosyltransferase SpsG
MTGAVLIVPCCEKGKGGGHLTRCIKLTNDLRVMGRNVWLYLPSIRYETENLIQSMNFNASWLVTENGLQDISPNIDFIVLDFFQASKEELARWKKIAPVFGIDEGGKYRDWFDFLIDILVPEKLGVPHANISSPSFLNFPSRPLPQKHNLNNKIKILVSFGQEDQSGLGLSVSKKLCRQNSGNLDITYITGELSGRQVEICHNINVLKSIPRLSERLCEYDLVITHYGITAYETLYAGTAVMLINPASYHKKLSKAAYFYTISNLPEINHVLLEKLKKHCKEQIFKLGLDKKSKSLANLISSLSPQVTRSCPVCGKVENNRSIARFTERTYRRCLYCGIIYMERIRLPIVKYDKEYFFDAYKKQYGKTYLEDFTNLTVLAKRRLSIIRSLLTKNEPGNPFILDIGCAYGPFLSAAKNEGFSPAGIDPAHDAVRYVQETLGIPAVQGFFPDCQLPYAPPYNIITLWYVIEHFRDCAAILTEIKKILKPGGILAFSTPSFSGISGRKSFHNFLEKSPADHFTVWSPKMCKKVLSLADFKVKKIVIRGHHPERFPLFEKFASNGNTLFFWLLLAISKIFCLGETFEVYALKK